MVAGWEKRRRERYWETGEGGRGTWGKPENSVAGCCHFSLHSHEHKPPRAHLLTASVVRTGDTDILKNKEGCFLPWVILTLRWCASNNTDGDRQIELHVLGVTGRIELDFASHYPRPFPQSEAALKAECICWNPVEIIHMFRFLIQK